MSVGVRDTVSGKKAHFFYGYWVLLVCFLTQLLKDGNTFYAFSLYVKPLTDTFNWSRGLIMGASTAAFLTMGLTSPLIGHLAYRFGAKKLIAAGAVMIGVILALLSLVQEAWQFYALEVALGVSFSAAGIIPCSMVIGEWFKKRRGFAIGVMGMGIGVGGFIMPRLIGMYLIPALGWRGAFRVSSIIVAGIITPLALLIIRAKPGDMGLHPDGIEPVDSVKEEANRLATSREGLSLKEARHTPAFWLMALAFATFSFASSAVFQNEVPHLENIGFSGAVAAAAFSFNGIGNAIGKFGFGWLCDYIPAKFTLVTGIVCQLIAVIILLAVSANSPESVLWLATFVFGLSVGSWFPSLSMMTGSIFGMMAYGTIFGMMNLIFHMSGSLGPLTAGLIYDMDKSYRRAFLLTIVFSLIALPAILLVRRPKNGKK